MWHERVNQTSIDWNMEKMKRFSDEIGCSFANFFFAPKMFEMDERAR